jgi:hypothetical protein
VSYLHQFLNTPQNRVVQQHDSIESLIKTLAPNLQTRPIQESVEQPAEKPLHKELSKKPSMKEEAEKLMQTPRDREIEKEIEKAIEKDLEEAFLTESLTLQEAITAQNHYKIYRDRDETFECKISVEGATLSNSFVRLILESDSWNILFTGKIYRDGRCVVPLKKMSIFPEGTIGKAHLEVIIDDSIFVPWEETFQVEGAKKVKVEIAPQSKISVNLKTEEENG